MFSGLPINQSITQLNDTLRNKTSKSLMQSSGFFFSFLKITNKTFKCPTLEQTAFLCSMLLQFALLTLDVTKSCQFNIVKRTEETKC